MVVYDCDGVTGMGCWDVVALGRQVPLVAGMREGYIRIAVT